MNTTIQDRLLYHKVNTAPGANPINLFTAVIEGGTIFNITTLGITSFGITTFIITTFIVTTFSIAIHKSQHSA